MSQEFFIDAVADLCRNLADLDFSAPNMLDQVRQEFNENSDRMTSLSELMKSGLEEGWLCDRENGPLRFSRVFKPSIESAQFSCDAVYMPDCSGPAHTHTNGELSWCVALDGSPQFDGFGPGWAFLPPGSTHTPTVSGGTMIIIYFLPDGAVEWS